MKKIHLVPNAITAFGLACGLFVIFKVNMIEPGFETFHVLNTASLFLLLAAFADLLDGAVARVMRAESEFGFMFDSLADAVSFGVAPAVLMLKSLSLEQGTGLSFFAVVGAMLFSICAVLRLVRFNVKASEVKGNVEAELANRKHFTGLPITAGALAAISANLFLASPFARHLLDWGDSTRAIVLTCLMIVLGYFMVSRWKFPSSKVLHLRVPSFHLVFFTVLGAIFFLYGMLYFFPVMLAVFSWSYVVLGWTLSIIRLIAGKKSRTLEEFEPESDEE